MANNSSKKKLMFSYNAPVVLTFALVSFVALILGYVTAGRSTNTFFTVYRSRISLLFFVRLFGHVLGHADLSHFANNMMMFLLLGPVLEEKYGSKDMLFMIGLTAVVSGLINIIFFSSGLLGASGIVFMFIVLVSATDVKKGIIPITLILVMAIYLGREIWTMVTVRDNISQLGHLIGGMCGAFFGLLPAFGDKK